MIAAQPAPAECPQFTMRVRTHGQPDQDSIHTRGIRRLQAALQQLEPLGRRRPGGTLNHITPEGRLHAFSLVRDGVPISCSNPIAR